MDSVQQSNRAGDTGRRGMRKVLIISPHYPPSNLAAVHRSRLFAQHLPEFGWEPHILTVHEDYYEEQCDWDLCSLLPEGQKIYKVKAFRVTRPRLIGDIGLRGFIFLYRKAVRIIKEEGIDFLYIPIPSFYGSLLGRLLHIRTGIRYGIDYIDPWVQVFPGSERRFSRHWWSTVLCRILEPIAVKQASLITGVAEGYYQGVVERNPRLKDTCIFGAMPYGGEVRDHEAMVGMQRRPYVFRDSGKFRFVYAGTIWDKSIPTLDAMMGAIAASAEHFSDVEFYFIGSGYKPYDPESYNVRPIAEKYGIWQTIVFELPQRVPYLDVLTHLDAADGLLILGSIEPHYTPSKVYQGVLSGKPILAVLHKASTAVAILRNSRAGVVLDFDGEPEIGLIRKNFRSVYDAYRTFAAGFDPANVDRGSLDEYSAKSVTGHLAKMLDEVVGEGASQGA